MSQLLQHFGFSHHPFSQYTSKKAIYLHKGFQEANKRIFFASEIYTIAMLIAESGCGKSLLLKYFSDEIRSQNWVVHYIAHSTLSPFSLINVLALKIGLSPKRSRGETAMAITDTFMQDERQCLLVIDEAHDLSNKTMEDIRLLTIGQFDQKNPFMLVLSGQPCLDDRLAEPIHYALDQRITTVAKLMPLSFDETQKYILHRLNGSNVNKTPVFEDGALNALYDYSTGVPRRINNIATSSLIVAASKGKYIVSEQDVHDAQIDRGRA